MKVLISLDKCVGCRICELACSFVLKGSFNPSGSNIRVYFRDDGGLSIEVPSDCVCEEKGPLCVDMCPTRAIELRA